MYRTITYFTSFFFSSSAHPQYLHSFPTRRSSDLRPARDAGAAAIVFLSRNGRFRGSRTVQPGRQRSARATRSEEHTSELQSPCNLVCRLLLEKKKRNAIKQRVRKRGERKLKDIL